MEFIIYACTSEERLQEKYETGGNATGAGFIEFDGTGVAAREDLVLEVVDQPMMTWSQFRSYANATALNTLGNTAYYQGNLAQARISVLDGAAVVPIHLNKHIDYNQRPESPATKANSLATPMGMVFDPLGTNVYVAAFGSNKIGIFDTKTEGDTLTYFFNTRYSENGIDGLTIPSTADTTYAQNVMSSPWRDSSA